MIIQLSETLDNGSKVSCFMGFIMIFGAAMLFDSLGWGTGMVIHSRNQTGCDIYQLIAFILIFGSLTALVWT